MIAVSPGHPQHSGVLIPEIWSGKLLVEFYNATCFNHIANHDYEGEISQMGDKVKIRTTPHAQVMDYQKGQKLVPQRLESSVVELDIDKAKYIMLAVEDVDRAQADIDFITDWADGASLDLKIQIDKTILQGIVPSAHGKNKGNSAGADSGDIALGAAGSPFETTRANVVDSIIDMGTVLDEQNVPAEDRFIVAPPWWISMIQKSELKDASLSGDDRSMARTGVVGNLNGFTILRSRQLLTTADSGDKVNSVLFGQNSALTFAAQVTKVQGPIVSQDSFEEFYRILTVYGYKVIKSEALGELYTVKGE